MKDKRKNVPRCESLSEWLQNNRLDKLGWYPTLSHGPSWFPQKCWYLFRIDILEITWLFSSQCTFVFCNSNKSIHLCTHTWCFQIFFLPRFLCEIYVLYIVYMYIFAINTHAAQFMVIWIHCGYNILYIFYIVYLVSRIAEKLYRSMHSNNLFHMNLLIYCL